MEKDSAESGLTLVEMLIAGVVLTIFVGIAFSYFSMSSTRGHALYTKTLSFVHASEFFAKDTGCYPNSLSSLGNAGSNGQAEGLNGCTPQQDQWDGPYLSNANFNGGNVVIPSSESGAANTVAKIETGSWMTGSGMMTGRGNVEIAIVMSPVSVSAQKAFCALCNGCYGQGQNAQSNAQTACIAPSNNSIGYVFATAQ